MLLIFLLKFCCQNCRVNQVYFRLFGNFTLQTYHITPVRSLIVKESRSWTCKETTKAQCTGFVFYQIVFLACFKENTYYSVIKMFHFALDLPMLFLQDLMSVLSCSYKKCRNLRLNLSVCVGSVWRTHLIVVIFKLCSLHGPAFRYQSVNKYRRKH